MQRDWPAWLFVIWAFLGLCLVYIGNSYLDSCEEYAKRAHTNKREAGEQGQQPDRAIGPRTFSEALKEKQAPKWEAPYSKKFCELKTGDLFTIYLATLTIAVGLLQIYFLWGTLNATAINADAASRSADAAIKAQMPVLLPLIVDAKLLPSDAELTHIPSLNYVLENHGRTPAIIIALKVELLVTAELPNAPPWDHPDIREDREVIPGDTRASAITAVFPYAFHRPLSTEEISELKEKPLPGQFRRFYFYGEVTYDDVFGYRHVRGFGRKVFASRGKDGFPPQAVRGHDKGYEYYRRIDRRTGNEA